MATNASAIQFNGSSRYLKLSANASLKNMSSFTWMAWIKVQAGSVNPLRRAYVERQGTGTGIRFACTPVRGKLRFELGVKDGGSKTNYDYAYTWDDRWHHVAYVGRISESNSTYEIILDGNRVAQGTLVHSNTVTAISNTAPMGGTIYAGAYSLHTSGGEVFPETSYWDGCIDEILIFNEAKNETDIRDYYNSNEIWNMGDTTMFSYWRLDEGTGEATGPTTTTDADNGGWTGTLHSTSGVLTGALWTVDRPFLGNGVEDTTAPTVPPVAGTPTTDPTKDGFTANWGVSTDNIWVQNYELDVGTASNFIGGSYVTYDAGRANSYKVTGLLPAFPYYWRVRAEDANGNTSAYQATQTLNTSSAGDQTAPTIPNLTTISSVTHIGFVPQWTASTDAVAVGGYKLDVAYDSDFVNYLDSYRNRDIGNVLSYAVSGVGPLTNYYVRVRAYDTSENESGHSNVLIVRTLPAPDTVAPLVVESDTATSIGSSSFVANWNVGSDNVGVVKYRLDVSTVEDFSSFVSGYNNRDVGNTLGFLVSNLTPETGYYYRVRAEDAAGNIGENTAQPMNVSTRPTTIIEGGYLTTVFDPELDTYISSATPTTSYNTSTVLTVDGSGAANTMAALFQFDLREIVGTVQTAMLRLFITNASVGSFSLKADGVTFATTTTWNTRPTVAGSALTFTPSSLNNYLEIDITSLLLDGNVQYTVEVTTLQTDEITIASKELGGDFMPQLVVESDPTTGTQVDSLSLGTLNGQRINYIKNPHGEDGTTTFWSTVATGVTLSAPVGGAANWTGTRLIQVFTSGSVANQGIEYTRTNTTTVQGDEWTATFIIRVSTGSVAAQVQLIEYTSGGVANGTTTQAVTIGPQYIRVSVSRKVSNATSTQIACRVQTAGTSVSTMYIGMSMLEKEPHSGGVFDGTTSGAFWSGTVNASTSIYNGGKLTFDATYLGDSDNDNSAIAYFKQSDQTEYWQLPSQINLAAFPVFNRSSKHATGTIPPGFGVGNFVPNPGFEIDTALWGANTTSERTEEVFADGSVASMKVTTAGINLGVATDVRIAIPSVNYAFRASMKIDVGNTATLVAYAYNLAGTLIGSSPSVLGENQLSGNGEWQTAKLVWTPPAGTFTVTIWLLSSTASAQVFYVDNVAMTMGSYVQPYLDGSMADGMWEGVPHKSSTAFQFQANRPYDVRVVFIDADGLYQGDTLTTGTITETVTTPNVPDNATTVSSLSVIPENNALNVTATWIGDDNFNNTAKIEWVRTDLTNWTEVEPLWNRSGRQLTTKIEDLNPGTGYTVRVTFTDANGVNGVNPITAIATTTTTGLVPDITSRISFGGFLLEGRDDGLIGVTFHDAFDFPEKRIQIETLARVEGAIELQNLFGERTVRMSGFVAGNTRGELKTNLDMLKQALARKKQRLVVDTLSNLGRYFTGSVSSFRAPETGGQGNAHLKWEAEFRCADPFAYDTVEQAITLTLVHNDPFTLSNTGHLPVDPVINISTSFIYDTSLTIANVTTGERLTPLVPIKVGDKLSVDCARLSLRRNGVEIDYAGSFPQLAVGGNNFVVSVTTTHSGIPSLATEIRWRQRYL